MLGGGVDAATLVADLGAGPPPPYTHTTQAEFSCLFFLRSLDRSDPTSVLLLYIFNAYTHYTS